MKIFIVGYYGFKNTGDDIMLYSILCQIYSPGLEISVLNCIPENVPESIRDKVKIIPLSFSKFIIEFMKTNLIILGGGTHLFSYGSFIQSFIINTRILFLVIASRITGKRIHFINIGVGSYDNKLIALVGRLACLFANKIIVRDYYSLAQLRSWGIMAIYSPDISVLYE